jgi:hypothetical protein
MRETLARVAMNRFFAVVAEAFSAVRESKRLIASAFQILVLRCPSLCPSKCLAERRYSTRRAPMVATDSRSVQLRENTLI